VVPVMAWAAVRGAPRTIEKRPGLAGLAMAAGSLLAVIWCFDPQSLTR
jgi:hypothetical protein